MKSPRQQRNEARRARHRAAWEAAAFESEQDIARRTREANDAARLARFEVQGRGFRPVLSQAPIVAQVEAAQAAPAVDLGGGDVGDSKADLLAVKHKNRGAQLGGGL